jgi:general secretion pathway protein B
MSFILDALRKSENERQENQPAEFSRVPSSPDSTPAPRWLWVLGILLVINILVIAAMMFAADKDEPAIRATDAGSTPAAQPAVTTATDDNPQSAAPPTFADRLEVARQNQPPRPASNTDAAGRAADTAAPNASAAPPQAASRTASGPATAEASLPGFDEVRLNGSVALPELHIDLHVYNEEPARRFVSINMQKYKENDTLAAGPSVHRITSDGVVLDYQGTRFVLRK